MSDLAFTLGAVGPTFLLVAVGVGLRLRGMVDEAFVRRSSDIVFHVSLPVLIVSHLATRDLSGMAPGLPMLLFAAGTLVACALAWLAAARLLPRPASRGAFVQGCFRSNVAIIGLPVAAGMLGEQALGPAIVLLALATPLYNVLAVVVLAVTAHERGRLRPARLAAAILRNPLLLAVVAGLAWQRTGWPLPGVAARTLGYLAQMTFPLALIGVGASLRRGMMTARLRPALAAAAVKTVLLPLAVCGAAYAAGLRDERLAVLFVVSGAPTAVASFIMAKAMRSDAELAAGIVLASTVLSPCTLSAGILLLRRLGAV